MIKVLFVCTGNICRSPMAEAVLRQLLNEAGLADQIEVDSAGTSNEEIGNTMHHGTVRVLSRHNVPHDSRRYARQITRNDTQEFTYLLAMDTGHLTRIQPIGGDGKAKMALFLSYANQLGTVKVEEVPDPWYTGRFDETYDLVRKGCEAFLAYLRKEYNL